MKFKITFWLLGTLTTVGIAFLMTVISVAGHQADIQSKTDAVEAKQIKAEEYLGKRLDSIQQDVREVRNILTPKKS